MFEPLRPLEGERVRLRPLEPDDFDALFLAASDPLIWEQHPESDRYRREVFERFFQGALDSRAAYVILDRESGEVIGSSRYRIPEDRPGAVEIGWTFLVRRHWGGATNREVKALMIGYAFEFYETVLFNIGSLNLRSRKAVEKLGATLEGEGSGDKVTYALARSAPAVTD